MNIKLLYPNALITVRPQELPEDFDPMRLHPEHTFTTYTKHYYIGSERINSKLGTVNNLGVLCEEMEPSTDLINEMTLRLRSGSGIDITIYLFSTDFNYSSIITNSTVGISQHTSPERSRRVEYLPFGETLVEEHLNSHNSPFKFNAKEYDAETGNYYYGARYYDPKWSTFLTPDPALESYPGISPYAYTLNNPVRYVDPTGMYVEENESVDTDIFKVYKNSDGSYRAERWQRINDGEDERMYLIMGDDGHATQRYQGVEAEFEMIKDGIRLENIDYGNTTTGLIKEAADWFFTSEDAKPARETVGNYITGVSLAITGPAALTEGGLLGFASKTSALGSVDDLSRMLTPSGSTVIQSVFGKETGNKIKVGMSGIGVSGSGASLLSKGVNTSDIISGSLDAKSIILNNSNKNVK